MSARDQLVVYHMSRLQDKRPEVRLGAIAELELLEATEAYSALEELYRSDPDRDVKRRAQAAGRVLYEKLQREKLQRQGGQS